MQDKLFVSETMSKGDVPTPYIVAFILAIVVIAVVAYLILTQSGLFSGEAMKKYCEGKRVAYCFDWQQASNGNFDKGQPSGGWDNYAKGCGEIGIIADVSECKALVGAT